MNPIHWGGHRFFTDFLSSSACLRISALSNQSPQTKHPARDTFLLPFRRMLMRPVMAEFVSARLCGCIWAPVTLWPHRSRGPTPPTPPTGPVGPRGPGTPIGLYSRIRFHVRLLWVSSTSCPEQAAENSMVKNQSIGYHTVHRAHTIRTQQVLARRQGQ